MGIMNISQLALFFSIIFVNTPNFTYARVCNMTDSQGMFCESKMAAIVQVERIKSSKTSQNGVNKSRIYVSAVHWLKPRDENRRDISLYTGRLDTLCQPKLDLSKTYLITGFHEVPNRFAYDLDCCEYIEELCKVKPVVLEGFAGTYECIKNKTG
ncbi:uncharacterized protein LOC141857924 [Brevipalpus obovatus]|uniref:uncharacterized protein LOC141857924 n=1 Tax=Brevipalpus obovatus TaxID=246614 RepID=UPI003D9E126D